MRHFAKFVVAQCIVCVLLLFAHRAQAQRVLTWDVYFDYGSARLSEEARQMLNTLPLGRATSVQVIGHTDGQGSESYNRDLAGRRAAAVAEQLARMQPGIAQPNVRAAGEENPAAPNEINGADNPEGRRQNRRVTIIATLPGPTMLIPPPPSA